MEERTKTGTAHDEASVRELYRALLDAWGEGDGEAYGALFTEDAEYVSFDGTRTRGREEIAASHQRLFDTWLKGTRLVGRVEGVRFVVPVVALAHAVGGTVTRNQTEPSPERRSIQTLVAVREGDEWRFGSFHNTRVRPIDRNVGTLLAWTLADAPWKLLRSS